MAAIDDLLHAPDVRRLVRPVPLTPPGPGRTVSSVTVVADVAALARAEPGALAILTGAASAATMGCRLDMLVRTAADRELSGIVVLQDESSVLDPAVEAIARRGRIRLLCAEPQTDLAALVVALHRELAGGADRALQRAAGALRALRAAVARGEDADALLSAVGDVLGVRPELREPTAVDASASLLVEGQVEGAVVIPRDDEREESIARELSLELVAGAVARAIEHERHTRDAPGQPRADFLTEFLAVDAHRAERLIDRAAALGLRLDAWHTVVRLEVEHPGDDELAAYETMRSIERTTLASARAAGGVWHRARSGTALLLLRMDRRDPGPHGARESVRLAGEIVAATGRRHPGVTLRCGVGSPHSGAAGLRRSAGEARMALSSHDDAHDDATPAVTSFDSMGMRRILLEWAATTTAADTIDLLLAPLDELGPRRADEAIRTLSAYLDGRGSLANTAATLHLHRNSLAYRIRKIVERIDVDLDDPEQWLALQLACRARLLAAGAPT
ncbi:PucR family transcriptional regulator [Conexibacter woesei]|uniref:Putative transcriptional regulator, PucR family n=1 Tax=Conexibacter woesei (strain DSM 14684 / CCUG 47730 / CIP 108061 / JCM 11494 / NBRC 100937 / ID131577) TaxID=469383 RepID=D3F5G3_CONWI|nr:helix-turn-helix domain-containing protein [Conexibacter woesei]ADB50630.1 putative transcriptional regulator, PucR family [Conexibacter woesei DSM 14684]